MGIEETEICIIKEPDRVIVYSDGISHVSGHETGTDHHNITESYEHINETTEHHSSEESTKEYEVKECTTEVSVKISDSSNTKKCEKLTSDFEGVFGEKSLKSHITKGNHKPRDNAKQGPAVGNLHSRCTGSVQKKPTVPQPFSLATEKRATVGTRPAFEEDKKGTCDRKSLNKKNVLCPNIVKQNQVYAVAESASFNYVDVFIFEEGLKKINPSITVPKICINREEKLHSSRCNFLHIHSIRL